MKISKTLKLILTVIIAVIGYFFKDRLDIGEQSKTGQASEIRMDTSRDIDFLPTSTTGQVVHHNSYSLSYSEEHEQAEWVAYVLKNTDITSVQRKRPYFIEDPKVKTRSADWKNYKKSGYDKGHLCPAGDRKYSEKAFNETFYTSNATPQKHVFNAGVWNRLEHKTRYWAKKYDELYVVTGSILTKNLKTIGREKVSVPQQFYKILLDYKEPEIKAIAFLVPHKESHEPLYNYVVSVDELEQLTGVDFFASLPDAIENKLESSRSYKHWSFR